MNKFMLTYSLLSEPQVTSPHLCPLHPSSPRIPSVLARPFSSPGTSITGSFQVNVAHYRAAGKEIPCLFSTLSSGSEVIVIRHGPAMQICSVIWGAPEETAATRQCPFLGVRIADWGKKGMTRQPVTSLDSRPKCLVPPSVPLLLVYLTDLL